MYKELNKETSTSTYLQSSVRANNVLDYSLLSLTLGKQVYNDLLKSRQSGAGHWDNGDVYKSSLALYALKQSSADASSSNVTTATEWLEKKKSTDGSWGQNVINTAVALIALRGSIGTITLTPPVEGIGIAKECESDEDCGTDELCDLETFKCTAKEEVPIEHCNNELLDEDEEDIDCGGADCAPCLGAEEEEEEEEAAAGAAPTERRTGLIILLIVIIIVAILGLLFLLFYVKKGKGFGDLVNDVKGWFKKKPKQPSFDEFLRTQPQKPLIQPRPLPSRPAERPLKATKDKFEEELEKSLKEAEKLLGKK